MKKETKIILKMNGTFKEGGSIKCDMEIDEDLTRRILNLVFNDQAAKGHSMEAIYSKDGKEVNRVKSK